MNKVTRRIMSAGPFGGRADVSLRRVLFRRAAISYPRLSPLSGGKDLRPRIPLVLYGSASGALLPELPLSWVTLREKEWCVGCRGLT